MIKNRIKSNFYYLFTISVIYFDHPCFKTPLLLVGWIYIIDVGKCEPLSLYPMTMREEIVHVAFSYIYIFLLNLIIVYVHIYSSITLFLTRAVFSAKLSIWEYALF